MRPIARRARAIGDMICVIGAIALRAAACRGPA
jgi:hypothetical protein